MHDTFEPHHSVDYDLEKVILELSDLFGPAADRKTGEVAYIDEHDGDIPTQPEDRDTPAPGPDPIVVFIQLAFKIFAHTILIFMDGPGEEMVVQLFIVN
jgi:hypothetical protein